MAQRMHRRKAMEYEPVIDRRPMPVIEAEVLARAVAQKPQQWFPAGRDPKDGAAIMKKVCRGPWVEEDVNGKTLRRRSVKTMYMKITSHGLLYDTVFK